MYTTNLNLLSDTTDNFEDIEKNNLNCFQFFIWCEIRRNVYISPFTLKSAVNPKWKRIFCIYIYLLLQYFWKFIFLTFIERSGMSKLLKCFLCIFLNYLFQVYVYILLFGFLELIILLKYYY